MPVSRFSNFPSSMGMQMRWLEQLCNSRDNAQSGFNPSCSSLFKVWAVEVILAHEAQFRGTSGESTSLHTAATSWKACPYSALKDTRKTLFFWRVRTTSPRWHAYANSCPSTHLPGIALQGCEKDEVERETAQMPQALKDSPQVEGWDTLRQWKTVGKA